MGACADVPHAPRPARRLIRPADQGGRTRALVRSASKKDLDPLAALTLRAEATYAEWAGERWRGQPHGQQRERWAECLADPLAWTAVATVDSEVVGGVSLSNARDDEGRGELLPGLAGLGWLFIDPGYWGRGIGGQLLRAAVAEMRRQGFKRAQLFTPAGNLRARRFYEQHGWRPGGGPTFHWEGLPVALYVLSL